MLKIVVSSSYQNVKKELVHFIENFDTVGNVFGEPARNAIKIVPFNGRLLNIKSFKKPSFIKSIIYGYFTKSKAERSFRYAHYLTDKGIGTPEPIAYFEQKNILGLKESFYISEHVEADLTYRELVQNPDYPEHTKILQAFTRFTFQLHENKVLFKDHSPGNTLIKKNLDSYNFYLVDLNRMSFKVLSFDERIANFSRLTPKEEMVSVMAAEYAQLIKEKEEVVAKKMWADTTKFQQKFFRKKRIKKVIFFWK